MKERLIKRVGRIISGSFNAVVDAIENAAPETVMEQALREIDDAVDDVRAELGKVVANKHLANTRLMEENRRHEEFSAKIELAVKENRDDLAETAIARQLDIEAQIPILEATISDCRAQETELEGYLSALQAKKREMREELRQFRKRNQEAAGAGPADGGRASKRSQTVEGRVARAESAFERIQEKATGLPRSAQASDRHSAAQLAELEDMARKNKIQERLAAIKKDVDTP